MATGTFPYAKRRSFWRPFLAGVAAPNREGGFVGAFKAGLGGAFAQNAADEAAAQAAAQEELRNQMEERLFGLKQRSTAADELMAQASMERATRETVPKLEDWQLSPEQQAKKIDYERRLAEATKGTPEETPPLSDEALDAAALRYGMTGQLPYLRGKQGPGYIAGIINRAGAKYPAANIAANTADYKKDSASLANVQKISDAAASWEDTVNRNSDVMLQYIDKIPEFGNRPANRLARYLASQAGDPNVSAFNSARETIKVEYARLLSSPGIGNAVLSDAARKEIEGIISGDLTVGQMKRSLSVLRQDAKNRLGAYSKKVEDIRSRLRSNPVGAAASELQSQPGQGQADWIYDPVTGEMVPGR